MINLQEIHDKYKQLKSLEKTCDWLKEEHNYITNRHRLSKMFKQAGLHVSPPNGWPDLHWTNTTSHLDSVGRLAAEMIKLAVDDLMGEGEPRMNLMSAAYFITSPLYELCLGAVMRNSYGRKITKETLPIGINIDKILKAREIYERNRKYWLN